MTPRLARGRSRIALLAVLLVVFAAVVPAVAAAETRAGGTVVVGPEETVGDLEVISGDVTILGTVDGDLSGVAGSVTIVGEVTGSVEVAAGSVRVEGRVSGDLDAGTGSLTIAEGGVVGGDLEAGTGSATIAGTVEGNARIGADLLVLEPTAHLRGDLEYDGELRGQDAATIDGTVTRNPDLSVGGFFDAGPLPRVGAAVLGVYFFLVNLVMGALLLLVFPRFADRLTASTLERPGRTALGGIAAFIGTPILLVLVALTIVGIPFMLLGIPAYLLALWVGFIYGRLVVGVWLLSFVDAGGRWAGFLVGMVVLAIVSRVPVLGGILDLFVLVLGLGALAMALRRAYRRRRAGGEDGETAAQRTLGEFEGRDEPVAGSG